MRKKLFFLLLLTLLYTAACHNRPSETKTSTGKEPTITEDLSDLSIYHLPSHWTNQDNEKIELVDMRGNIVVMVMIYTSCQAACPRLVADMRHIEKSVSSKNKEKIRYVLVSIDPEVDTPERLKSFAKKNQMDEKPWVFLRSDEESTREFAAILAVNYKRISPIDFSHSNIISVFNGQGELVFQQEGLGVDYSTTIARIEEEANQL
ncbi:MAG TPA: SCO family protein [Sphingobacterium sp.]|nr:SCO family protein [Sphingobacterium sp.]